MCLWCNFIIIIFFFFLNSSHTHTTQIDEPNAFGNTALHVACYMGQEAVANELVNRGANVNQPNQRGFSPLHLAAVSTNGALCLELLVNNGADVNMQVCYSHRITTRNVFLFLRTFDAFPLNSA